MMRTQLISLAVGIFTLLVMATRVDAHAFLVRAEPRVGSKMEKAPTEVRIWFSESIQPASSSIKIFDEKGKQVDKKNTHSDRASPALLDVSLMPELALGTYRVIWHVTSVDTHVTNGHFTFRIVPRYDQMR